MRLAPTCAVDWADGQPPELAVPDLLRPWSCGRYSVPVLARTHSGVHDVMTVTNERPRQDSPRARIRLIRAFAVRDLKARFTATSLGLVWTLIVPIATVVIYSAVFALIFRAQAPPMGNGNDGIFAAWFFVGYVVWNTFSQVTTGGMGSILGMGAMMQKVFIPSYVPVLASAATLAVEKLIETGVMLAVPPRPDECGLDVAVVPIRARGAVGVRRRLVLLPRGRHRALP